MKTELAFLRCRGLSSREAERNVSKKSRSNANHVHSLLDQPATMMESPGVFRRSASKPPVLRLGMGILLALFAKGILATPAASADVILSSFNHQTGSFLYEIEHMPDLDQRRESTPSSFGLPGNGSMYCAPTSAMNMMMYVANHGFPEMNPPGAGDWQSQTRYDDATSRIAALGMEMGTHATNGTTGDGFKTGLQAWLELYGKFTVHYDQAGGNYSPTLDVIVKSAVIGGSLVSFGHHRWENIGLVEGARFVNAIPSGHVVTLSVASRSSRASGSTVVGVRDPANGDSNKTMQAPFANTFFNVEDHLLTHTDGGGDNWTRVMSILNFNASAGVLSIIGDYVAIRPKAGYSLTSDGLYFVPHIPTLFDPGFPCCDPIASPTGTRILAIADHPDGIGYLVLVEGGPASPEALYLIGPGDQMPEFLLELQGATAMALGRNRSLYIVRSTGPTSGDVLERITLDPQPATLASIPLSLPVQAIATDDAADEVVLLSTTNSMVMRIDFGLVGAPSQLDISGVVPLSGEAQISVSPADGSLWMLTDASSSLFGLSTGVTGGLSTEAIDPMGDNQPSGFDFDDAGHLFVARDGLIVEFERNGVGSWQELTNSLFAGLQSEGVLRMTRSRTNYDPSSDSTPPYNILPEEVIAGDPLQLAYPNGWSLAGIAEGGQIISFTVEDIPLQITTMAGQTAAEIATAMADEILLDSTLQSYGIYSRGADTRILVGGSVSGLDIGDAGVTAASLPSVPGLGLWAVGILGLSLLATGALHGDRQNS